MFVKPEPGQLPLTDPTVRLSSVPEGASATVVDQFNAADGTPFGNGHCLVLRKDIESEHGFWIPFHVHPADRVTSGKLTIEFDFYIDDQSDPPIFGNMFIATRNSEDEAASTLMFQPDGKLTLRRHGEEMSFVSILEKGRAYHIKQVFDFQSGTVQVYLDGVESGEAQAFDMGNKGISGLDISVLAPNKGKWVIDNVSVTATDD